MTSPVSAVEAIEKAMREAAVNLVDTLVLERETNGQSKEFSDWAVFMVMRAFNVQRADAASQAEALNRENAEVAKAVLEVLDAVRDYLPPDGISARDCLSRVISAVDNSAINPLIKKLEHINVDA